MLIFLFIHIGQIKIEYLIKLFLLLILDSKLHCIFEIMALTFITDLKVLADEMQIVKRLHSKAKQHVLDCRSSIVLERTICEFSRKPYILKTSKAYAEYVKAFHAERHLHSIYDSILRQIHLVHTLRGL